MSDTTYAHALNELLSLKPGSVVLDEDGDAWQMIGRSWTCVIRSTNTELMSAASVAILAPITVIHRAP